MWPFITSLKPQRKPSPLLKQRDLSDVDGPELFQALSKLRYQLPKHTTLKILTYLKRLDSCLNAFNVYKILLTIPITIASAKWIFPKLKLLKSYLQSMMPHEWLNWLVLISIEQDLLEKIDFENIINEFVLKNVRRSIFKWYFIFLILWMIK